MNTVHSARRSLRSITALLVTLLLLGTGGCALGSNPLEKDITVTAYFKTAAGLFTGNDVGILGVKVGRVASIEPAGNRVKVELKVKSDTAIPASAGAVVVSRSAATDRYVELTPVWTAGPRMKDHGIIPLARTRTPVEFDEVLSSLGSLAEGISGSGATRRAVARLLKESSSTLAGNGQLLNDTIGSLSDATNTLHGQRKNAEATLTALDGLTQTIATNQQTVRSFIGQVGKASQLLAQERKNFRTTLREVTRMITQVSDFAKDNRKELRRVVGHTNATLQTVVDKRKQTAEILRTLPLAVQNLQRVQKDNGRLRVRLDPTELVPLGNLLQSVCQLLPGDLCTGIGLDPTVLIDNLLGLLGGKQ